MIRNVTLNNEEIRAHLKAGAAPAEGASRKVKGFAIGSSETIQELYTSVHSAINCGLEWKDTLVVLDTAAESSCFNNAMLLNSLARRQQPLRYQSIGSGVLESKHHGVFVNKLWVDYLPNLPMNLLSLSQITLNTQWEVRYEHA